MKKLILSTFVFLTTGVFAQSSILWGVGASQGNDEGTFSSSFVNSITANNYNTTNWTALSLFDNGGSNAPGAAFWTQTTGASQGAYGTAIITSPSVADGYALFDSDYLDNGGVQVQGGGSSPSDHRGELISPRIDLSGNTNETLEVKFYYACRKYQAQILVSFSVDDGATWTDVDINTLYPTAQNSSNDGWVIARFPSVTAGVSNLSQCRIRFVFDGSYYYYMVDDLSISITDPINLTIAKEDTVANTLAGSLFYSSISNNRHFPISQLNAHHFIAGANIKNIGYDTIVPADSAKLFVTIEKRQGSTWNSVYNQSIAIDSVYPEQGRVISAALTNTSWATIGQFRTQYLVHHSNDANHDNDTLYQYFDLNNNNYASKVGIDANGLPEHTGSKFPNSSYSANYADLEFGSMFEFYDVTNASLAIDSVSFAYYVPSTLSIAINHQTISVKIYQFIDGSSGGIADGKIDPNGNELIHKGEQLVTIAISSQGVYGTATVSGFVNPFTGNPMQTLQSGYYLVTLQNLASYNGTSSFSANTTLHFAVSETDNYTLNMNQVSGANLIANASPTKTTYSGSTTTTWDWLGFGADIVPSIGVHLSGTCNSTINTATSVTGNTISVTTPQAGQTYQWMNCVNNTPVLGETTANYTPITSGNYAVEITANSCVDTSTCQNVTIATTILVNSISVQGQGGFSTIATTNGTLQMEATVLPANATDGTYTWSVANGTGSATIDANGLLTAITNGVVTASATANDASGVTGSTVITISNQAGVGINEANFTLLNVYPNPTKGMLFVEVDKKVKRIEVYSVLGELSASIFNVKTIDVSDLVSGVYFIRIELDSNEIITRGIVKE